MKLKKAGLPMGKEALWVDYSGEHDHPKNRSTIDRRRPGSVYSRSKRLTAQCDLPWCNPEFNTLFFEPAAVTAYQDRIDRGGEAKAKRAADLRLCLSPVLEFMPSRATTAFKDFIGAACDGLIDSSSLLSGADFRNSDYVCLRWCACSHDVLHDFACASLTRENFLGWTHERFKMHRAREGAGDQASFFGLCHHKVGEFAVLVPSDMDGGFEYDACELHLPVRLPHRSFDQGF